MPKIVYSKQNFNAGELSRKLRNRFELSLYYNGVERIQNFIPVKEGEADFRTGLAYFLGVKSNNKGRLLPFIPSEENSYLLEFTSGFIRIYANNNTTIVQEIVSVYLEADLPNLQYAQTQDIMYIVDGTRTIYELKRTSVSTFTFLPADMDTTPAYIDENLTAETMTSSATAIGPATITWSVPKFDDTYIGRYIQIRDPATITGFAQITSITSTTIAVVSIISTLPAIAAYTTWSLSATPNGIAFYQSRLWIGQDDIIWGSRSTDVDGLSRFLDFTLNDSGTINVDNAIKFISGLFKTSVLWLNSNDKTLLCGCSDSVFLLDSLNSQNPLNPKDHFPDIKIISKDGSKRITPVKKDNVLFYVNNAGERINAVFYRYESDGFVVNDTNVYSEDVIDATPTELEFNEQDDSVVYVIKSDGKMALLNYVPEQQINGWFRIETDGEFESIAILPETNNKNTVYVIVKRTVNSSTVRYIETFTNEVIIPSEVDYYTGVQETDEANYDKALYITQKDYNFLDSSLSYDGSDQTATMTPSALTGDDVLFTSDIALFASSDVGREIWDYNGIGRGKIIEYLTNKTVKCNIISDFTTLDTMIAGNWYFTTDTVTGLGHLEAKKVKVILDGGFSANTFTVASGSITIGQQASFITVGLAYRGLIKTFNIDGGSQNGSSRSKPKILTKVSAVVYNSIGGKVGTDPYNLEKIQYGPADIYGRPIKVFSGSKDISIADAHSAEKNVYLVQDDPMPFNVQLLNLTMDTNEND